MKKLALIAIIITTHFNLMAQNDLVVGNSYELNIQRKNSHGDAFILHNAEYSQGQDQLKWENTHPNFGSRGIRFGYSTNRGIYFYADEVSTTAGVEFTPTTRFFIGNNGKIGVGTTAPTQKLSVDGKINAEEIILEDVAGADFVFEEDYDLRSLEETEEFIKANKHLPEIPSAAEMAEEGLEIKTMNILLLQKVEELTLHLIRMEKEAKVMVTKFDAQSTELVELKAAFEQLKDNQ